MKELNQIHLGIPLQLHPHLPKTFHSKILVDILNFRRFDFYKGFNIDFLVVGGLEEGIVSQILAKLNHLLGDIACLANQGQRAIVSVSNVSELVHITQQIAQSVVPHPNLLQHRQLFCL